MPAPRTLTVAAVAGAVAAGALVVGLFVGDRGSGEETSTTLAPLVASGTIVPRIVLFGDTLTAHVDVVLDRNVVDAEQVDVTWEPRPWVLVRTPEQTHADAGPSAHLRTTFVLRCLTRLCVPARETEEIEFPQARVSYVASVGEGTRRLSLDVTWPLLTVHTRVRSSDATQRDALAAPWRADLVSLPAVSHRVRPGAALAVLVALALLFLGVAAGVTYRKWPRREPAPEPEPPPPPVASPLEQALALLEAPPSVNGAKERRRALELVADEVERLGDAGLAEAARALAWSEEEPEGEVTRAFATRLRSELEVPHVAPA